MEVGAVWVGLTRSVLTPCLRVPLGGIFTCEWASRLSVPHPSSL